MRDKRRNKCYKMKKKESKKDCKIHRAVNCKVKIFFRNVMPCSLVDSYSTNNAEMQCASIFRAEGIRLVGNICTVPAYQTDGVTCLKTNFEECEL